MSGALTLSENKALDNMLRINQQSLLMVSTRVRKGLSDKKALGVTQDKQRAAVIRHVEVLIEGKIQK